MLGGGSPALSRANQAHCRAALHRLPGAGRGSRDAARVHARPRPFVSGGGASCGSAPLLSACVAYLPPLPFFLAVLARALLLHESRPGALPGFPESDGCERRHGGGDGDLAAHPRNISSCATVPFAF